MIAVIFEVEPHADRAGQYFDIAADLKPHLEAIDGFISIERFESLSTPGKYLSLSFWRDEAAIMAWRSVPGHRRAQRLGRSTIFRTIACASPASSAIMALTPAARHPPTAARSMVR